MYTLELFTYKNMQNGKFLYFGGNVDLTKVTICSTDDWIALYIDGKLALDGNSLPLRSILEVLGVNVEYKELPQIAYSEGCIVFTEQLDDVHVVKYEDV